MLWYDKSCKNANKPYQKAKCPCPLGCGRGVAWCAERKDSGHSPVVEARLFRSQVAEHEYGGGLKVLVLVFDHLDQTINTELQVVVAEHHPEVDVPHSLSGPDPLVPVEVDGLGQGASSHQPHELFVAGGDDECGIEELVLPLGPSFRTVEQRLHMLLRNDEVASDRHLVSLDHLDQVGVSAFHHDPDLPVSGTERTQLSFGVGKHTDLPPETLMIRTIRTRQVYQIIKLTQCPLICPESANGSGEFEHRKRCREIGCTAPELLLNIISTTQAATKKLKNFTF